MKSLPRGARPSGWGGGGVRRGCPAGDPTHLAHGWGPRLRHPPAVSLVTTLVGGRAPHEVVRWQRRAKARRPSKSSSAHNEGAGRRAAPHSARNTFAAFTPSPRAPHTVGGDPPPPFFLVCAHVRVVLPVFCASASPLHSHPPPASPPPPLPPTRLPCKPPLFLPRLRAFLLPGGWVGGCVPRWHRAGGPLTRPR